MKILTIILCGFKIKNVVEIAENVIEITFPPHITKECLRKKLDEIIILDNKKKIANIWEVELTYNDTIKIKYEWNKNINFIDNSKKKDIEKEQEKLLEEIKKDYCFIRQFEEDVKQSIKEFERLIDLGLEEYPGNQQALPYYEDLTILEEFKNDIHKKMKRYIRNYEESHYGKEKMIKRMKKCLKKYGYYHQQTTKRKRNNNHDNSVNF